MNKMEPGQMQALLAALEKGPIYGAPIEIRKGNDGLWRGKVLTGLPRCVHCGWPIIEGEPQHECTKP